ncbi:hypothetical protein MTO96_013966 [Rhipicephalus appendiculatus]
MPMLWPSSDCDFPASFPPGVAYSFPFESPGAVWREVAPGLAAVAAAQAGNQFAFNKAWGAVAVGIRCRRRARGGEEEALGAGAMLAPEATECSETRR